MLWGMPRITRRSFLEHTLSCAAAGLALQRRCSAQTAPVASTGGAIVRPSANERIGVAVVGLHGRGIDHLNAFVRLADVDVIALCDVDQRTFAKAQAILHKHDRPAARDYQDIRKLLDDKDVAAVSIATPNHWHALAGIWAMQAGKDAYVEKPVSHDLLEGVRLEEARIKYKRVCQAGTQSRSNPAHQQAIGFVHEGGIGRVTLARGLCYKRRNSIGHYEDSSAPSEVDYNIWLGPARERPFNQNRFHYNWHWNWDYGNGDLGNQGVHQVDVARWALGAQMPTSAIGLGGRFGYVDDGQTPNTLLALFDYGQAQLLFEVRGLPTQPLMGVSVGNIIYGSEGFVAISNEDSGSAVAFDNAGKPMRSFTGSGDHFANFIAAVSSRKQSDLRCPILEGHLSAALCHLANISYRLGEPHPFSSRTTAFGDKIDMYEAFGRFEQHLAESVDEMKKPLKLQEMAFQLGPKLIFDAHAARFASNERANALLTRDYRKPFVVPDVV